MHGKTTTVAHGETPWHAVSHRDHSGRRGGHVATVHSGQTGHVASGHPASGHRPTVTAASGRRVASDRGQWPATRGQRPDSGHPLRVLARVVPHQRRRGGLITWSAIVDCCPFCRREHRHGAGIGDRPYAVLGITSAHCGTRRIRGTWPDVTFEGDGTYELVANPIEPIRSSAALAEQLDAERERVSRAWAA